MKKVFMLVMFVALTSGCIGRFALTKKVYDFNTSIGSKWANELVFLAFVIVPVYGLSTLGDAIVFNSIEFWTGDNVLAKNKGEFAPKLADADGSHIVMTYDAESGDIKVNSFDAKYAPQQMLVLNKSERGVVAKDKSGGIIYTASTDESGGVSVCDSEGKQVKYFTAQEAVK